MRQIRTFAACAALALSATTAVAAGSDDDASKGEAELAEFLDGRVAGEPQRCISDLAGDNLTIIDETAMVFRSGSTYYVNRTTNARWLDWDDVPVFERRGSQICKQDRVELRDRFSLMRGPILFLSDFTPYTKVDSEPNQGESE